MAAEAPPSPVSSSGEAGLRPLCARGANPECAREAPENSEPLSRTPAPESASRPEPRACSCLAGPQLPGLLSPQAQLPPSQVPRPWGTRRAGRFLPQSFLRRLLVQRLVQSCLAQQSVCGKLCRAVLREENVVTNADMSWQMGRRVWYRLSTLPPQRRLTARAGRGR